MTRDTQFILLSSRNTSNFHRTRTRLFFVLILTKLQISVLLMITHGSNVLNIELFHLMISINSVYVFKTSINCSYYGGCSLGKYIKTYFPPYYTAEFQCRDHTTIPAVVAEWSKHLTPMTGDRCSHLTALLRAYMVLLSGGV